MCRRGTFNRNVGTSHRDNTKNVYDAPLHTSKQARVGALLLSHPGLSSTGWVPAWTHTVHPQPHVHAHTTQVTDTRDVNTGEDHPSKMESSEDAIRIK